MRACTKCKEEKVEEAFVIRKDRGTGRGSVCKPCDNVRKLAARQTPHRKAKDAEYRKNRSPKWYIENREYCSARSLQYYHENKDRIRERINARAKTDTMFILKRNVRKALARAFKRIRSHKNDASQALLGCDWAFLQAHLISTALQRYGYWLDCETYEIDHIVPLSSAETLDDVQRLSHYTNLQLLTQFDNRTKSDMDEAEWQRRQSKSSSPTSQSAV